MEKKEIIEINGVKKEFNKMTEVKNNVYVLDKEAAIQSEQVTQMSGPYIVRVVEAVTGESASGARFVDLKIEILKRTDNEGNPKQYNIKRMYITAGKQKDYRKTFKGNQFDSLFLLLDTKPTIKKRKAMVWEDRNQIEKAVDQFTEILNKPIGAVVQMTYEWRRMRIDGYTKETLLPEDAVQATHVWIDNYESEPVINFDITCFFMHDGDYKGYTYSEIVKAENGGSVKPANLKRAISRIKAYEFDSNGVVLPLLSNEKVYDYITKELKRNLERAGLVFDKEKLQPYRGTSLVDSGDVPF